MEIEQLETLWNTQQPANVGGTEPAKLTNHLATELRRRSRMFLYAFICLGLAGVLVPLLAVVNYLYAAPVASPALYWFRAALATTVTWGTPKAMRSASRMIASIGPKVRSPVTSTCFTPATLPAGRHDRIWP